MIPHSVKHILGLAGGRRASHNSCSGPPCRQMLLDPYGKVAVVTGAGCGIGYAAASELLVNGLKLVVVAEKDEVKGTEAARQLCGMFGSSKAFYMPCDINCCKQFEDVFRLVSERCRGIDILFNNAGIIDDKNFHLAISTNVVGSLRGNLLAQKYMAGKGGVVINGTSTAGIAPWPNCPVYSATSHAIVAASRCFGDRFHFGLTKVRTIGLCVGFTKTAVWENSLSRHLIDDWSEETMKCIERTKMQPPEIVGKAVVHLVKYGQTGSTFTCENGFLHEIMFPSESKALKPEPMKMSMSKA